MNGPSPSSVTWQTAESACCSTTQAWQGRGLGAAPNPGRFPPHSGSVQMTGLRPDAPLHQEQSRRSAPSRPLSAAKARPSCRPHRRIREVITYKHYPDSSAFPSPQTSVIHGDSGSDCGPIRIHHGSQTLPDRLSSNNLGGGNRNSQRNSAVLRASSRPKTEPVGRFGKVVNTKACHRSAKRKPAGSAASRERQDPGPEFNAVVLKSTCPER